MKSNNQCYQFLVYPSRITLNIQAYVYTYILYKYTNENIYTVLCICPSSIAFRSVILNEFFPFYLDTILVLVNITLNLNSIITPREPQGNFE